MKKLLAKIKEKQHLILISICCLIIGIFWTYLLLQQEVRNSLSLVVESLNFPHSVIIVILILLIKWLYEKAKDFKDELFRELRYIQELLNFIMGKLK